MIIHTLDLRFQGLEHAIAAYLVEGPTGAVLIETGPGSTLPALLEALRAHGLEPADVRHVLVTHIHLDHAGAAGWWANQGAQVYVHPVGAPHIVDPSRLLKSAGRIYGDKMDVLWGETQAAPADKVTVVHDGDVLKIHGLEIRAIDTPGHASHHHVYRIGDVAFTGDAAGVRINGQDHLDVPAVPPEFDKEAWYRTIDRLQAEDLSAIYPTHFGRVDDVSYHLDELRSLIGELSGFVHGMMVMGADRESMVERYVDWNRDRAKANGASEASIGQSDLANPLAMSVDGISRYWRKRMGW